MARLQCTGPKQNRNRPTHRRRDVRASLSPGAVPAHRSGVAAWPTAPTRRTDENWRPRPSTSAEPFQIADAVDVKRHPVVAQDHFPSGLGMDRVGIVQQGRAEDAGNVNHQPQEQKNEQEYLALASEIESGS